MIREVKKVVFALTGDVRSNSRALKQLQLLSDMSFSVDVLHLGSGGTAGLPHLVQAISVPRPNYTGPRFFAAVHRRFSMSARLHAADVYHASDLYVLPAMCAAARKNGGKVVYDIRELYPHVASTAGRPWARAVWRFVEKRFIKKVHATFTVGERIAQEVASAYQIPEPTVLYNAPPTTTVTRSSVLERVRRDKQILLLHQGNIQKHRGCEILLRAMVQLSGAQLIFLGGGPLKPQIKALSAALGLDAKVHFLDPVPPHELLSVTAGADIGISLLEDTCLNHRLALPNKLFEYLMAGIPVLVSNMPEMTKLVTIYGVGCSVAPHQPEALVRTLQSMINDTGARARWRRNTHKVFETYGWEIASERFKFDYRQLVST